MKLKKYNVVLFCIALICLSNQLAAQFKLSGKVISPGSKPVSFASVALKNSFLSSTTNSEGNFEFKNLRSGQYIITAYCLGYKPKTDTIELSSDASLEIVLTSADVSLDEIVVSSSRVNKTTGFVYTNISSEEISKQNVGQDLPYVLNTAPSVVINSDAGNGVGYTGMRIRGSDGTRINVTINGVPVNDAESQGSFFVDMPDLLSSTNNIQIQRGVGTSVNGAGAFGASVNMQTNQLNEKPYAQINNSFGSFNTIKNTVAAGTGLLNGHFTLDARASRINSTGFINRASSNLGAVYIAGGYYGKKTAIKLIAFSGWEKTYQAWYYVPEDSIKKGNRTFNPAGMYFDNNGNVQYYNNETDNYRQDNYQLHLTHQFSEKLTANITGHYTAGKGYYEQFKQGEALSKYNLPAVITPKDTIYTSDLVRRLWLDNDFSGFVYNVNYKATKRINFTLGGGYNTYFGKHNGEVVWAQFANTSTMKHRYYDDKATKKDLNSFLKISINPIDRLHLFIDLQYRHINYDFLGYDNLLVAKQQQVEYTFINPKFGLNYFITSNTNIYATYAIAHKEPNRDDFVQSSPQSRPKSEQLNDLELGISHNRKKMRMAINYYDMEYKNQLVLNGQVNDVGAYNRVNVPTSYRRGIELEAGVDLGKYFAINANLTLSKNKIKGFVEYIDSSDASYSIYTQYKKQYSETDISFSPNVISGANLTIKPIRNMELCFVNKYVGRQYLDNTSDVNRSINPYLVNDLRLNYTIRTKYIKEIGFAFIVYNIFGRHYETNGYTFSYYTDAKLYTQNYLAPSAGRHYMLALNLKF